jgi:transposase
VHPLGKAKRCVWSIPTKPFTGEHYAVYPPGLIETPIKAGCPKGTPLYGRAPRGQRVVGSVPQNYGSNLTMIAALGTGGLSAPMTVEAATDGDVFRAWTQQVLCPTLEKGDIVVMDNLGAHKVSGIREAIEGRGAKLIYLPPYSPDLSPIEHCWSKVKTALRAAGARTHRRLQGAIKQALSTVTESDALAWFAHCGYELN